LISLQNRLPVLGSRFIYLLETRIFLVIQRFITDFKGFICEFSCCFAILYLWSEYYPEVFV